MKIIVGRTDTGLDCIGSMVLALQLSPDHRPARSRQVHAGLSRRRPEPG